MTSYKFSQSGKVNFDRWSAEHIIGGVSLVKEALRSFDRRKDDNEAMGFFEAPANVTISGKPEVFYAFYDDDLVKSKI